jgi:hypothetical protein
MVSPNLAANVEALTLPGRFELSNLPLFGAFKGKDDDDTRLPDFAVEHLLIPSPFRCGAGEK